MKLLDKLCKDMGTPKLCPDAIRKELIKWLDTQRPDIARHSLYKQGWHGLVKKIKEEV